MNEKYTDLIKEIAGIITDGERERYWLKAELAEAKDMLERAERKLAEYERAGCGTKEVKNHA